MKIQELFPETTTNMEGYMLNKLARQIDILETINEDLFRQVCEQNQIINVIEDIMSIDEKLGYISGGIFDSKEDYYVLKKLLEKRRIAKEEE